MPLLREDAELLSRDSLEAGVIEEIIDKEELYALLPFMKVIGKAYVYDRENGLPDADFLDPNDTVNEGGATFTEVTSKLRVLIGDVDVDKFLDSTMDDTNDQKAIQIAAKSKAVSRKFKNTLINGDNSSRPKEFDGVLRLITADQTVDVTEFDSSKVNGSALTFSMLDYLLDMVPNGADCLMMRSGTVRAYKALCRAMNGNDGEMVQIPNFGKAVLSHDGTPIIKNDFLPGTETFGTSTATCSIVALRLNEADGVHGLYGGASAGFVVEDIGTVQNKDATRTRVKWYCGLAQKSTKSAARLKGITNV